MSQSVVEPLISARFEAQETFWANFQFSCARRMQWGGDRAIKRLILRSVGEGQVNDNNNIVGDSEEYEEFKKSIEWVNFKSNDRWRRPICWCYDSLQIHKHLEVELTPLDRSILQTYKLIDFFFSSSLGEEIKINWWSCFKLHRKHKLIVYQSQESKIDAFESIISHSRSRVIALRTCPMARSQLKNWN